MGGPRQYWQVEEGKEGRKPSDAAAAAHLCDTAADSNQQLLAFPQQTLTAAAEIKLEVEIYWGLGKS